MDADSGSLSATARSMPGRTTFGSRPMVRRFAVMGVSTWPIPAVGTPSGDPHVGAFNRSSLGKEKREPDMLLAEGEHGAAVAADGDDSISDPLREGDGLDGAR